MPRKLSQVEIVDKVSSVTGKRVVLQPLHVDRSDDVEVTRRRNQDVDLKQDSFNGHYLHACKTQKGHIRLTTYEYQNHRERKSNPCRICHRRALPTIITTVACGTLSLSDENRTISKRQQILAMETFGANSENHFCATAAFGVNRRTGTICPRNGSICRESECSWQRKTNRVT